MSSDAAESVAFMNMTDNNKKMFCLVVKHAKTLDVDWDAVAAEGGFKDGNSARGSFGNATRKLGIAISTSGSATAAPGTPGKTPRKTPVKRKAKDDGEKSSAKKAKANKASKTADGDIDVNGKRAEKPIKDEPVESDDDGDDDGDGA